MKDKAGNIIPAQPSPGPNAARVIENRDAPGGGARAIADQPGVVPDQPFQGTPPKPEDLEPTKPVPTQPGPTDHIDSKKIWGPGNKRRAEGSKSTDEERITAADTHAK